MDAMLTLSTPSIFRHPVTTCDAQELHISAEISSETSSTSVATVAGETPVVGAGAPHATAIAAAEKSKGAKRTSSLCAWRPGSRCVRTR